MVMRADSLSEAAANNTRAPAERKAPITPLGLTDAERSELVWFFQSAESEVGLRSSTPAQIEGVAMERRRRADGRDEWIPSTVAVGNGKPGGRLFNDPVPDIIDRGIVRRLRAVHHALLAMPGHHVTVLWLLYGAGQRCEHRDVFGEVAPIVHLTQAVEEARELMALHEGEVRYERVTAEFDESAEDTKSAVARDFWHFAGRLMAAEERLAARRGRPRCATPRGLRITTELELRAAGLRETLRQLLAAHAYDGLASAQATAMGSADREATPQAAIRWRFEFHGARLENGAPHPDALRAHQEAKKLLTASARREAERMRITAAQAYRAARAAVRIDERRSNEVVERDMANWTAITRERRWRIEQAVADRGARRGEGT